MKSYALGWWLFWLAVAIVFTAFIVVALTWYGVIPDGAGRVIVEIIAKSFPGFFLGVVVGHLLASRG
jgi:hypothetical protein